MRARCVINAAGPWVEAVRRLEDPRRGPCCTSRRACTSCVPAARLPVNHLVILQADDRRSIFVIRHGACVYLGTTDTTYGPGAELWPEIGPRTSSTCSSPPPALPAIRLRPADVIAAWAGLRPLIAEPGKPPTEISRKDEVLLGPAGVVTLAGGKLTGYRPMARETARQGGRGLRACTPRRGRSRRSRAATSTAISPASRRAWCASSASAGRAARLVRLYGTEARSWRALGPEPLVAGTAVLAGEVDWAVGVGVAASSRTSSTGACAPPSTSPARARRARAGGERMAALLGWDAERTRREIAPCARAWLRTSIFWKNPG